MRPGQRIILQNLNAAEFNGRQGTLVQYHESRGRWEVNVDGSSKLFKEENLLEVSFGIGDYVQTPSGYGRITSYDIANNQWEVEHDNSGCEVFETSAIMKCKEDSLDNVIHQLSHLMKLKSIDSVLTSVTLSSTPAMRNMQYESFFNASRNQKLSMARIIKVFQDVGISFRRQGRLDLAESLYRYALRKSEEENILMGRLYVTEALCVVLGMHGDYEQKISYLERALGIEVPGSEAIRARLLCQKAGAIQRGRSFPQMRLSEIRATRDCFQEAMALLNSIPDSPLHWNVYRDYVIFLMDVGHHAEALKFLNVLLERSETRSKEEIFTIRQCLCDVYFGMENYDRALAEGLVATKMLRDIGSSSYIDEFVTLLFRITHFYMHMGEFGKCAEQLQQLESLLGSMHDQSSLAAYKIHVARTKDSIRRKSRDYVLEFFRSNKDLKKEEVKIAKKLNIQPMKCARRAYAKERECATCFAKHVKLYSCKRCENVYYCSKRCQKADWKVHKSYCKRPK